MADFLSKLPAPVGANTNPLRKGRGVGSGLGKTAGKGQKGQKARHPGNFGKLGFQGGQTPLQRRLPKRGFRNPFAAEVVEVNVGSLAKKFAAGATVDIDGLRAAGLVKGAFDAVKLLGDGELTHALTVRVHKASESAKGKIEKAGGRLELIEAKKQEAGEPKAG